MLESPCRPTLLRRRRRTSSIFPQLQRMDVSYVAVAVCTGDILVPNAIMRDVHVGVRFHFLKTFIETEDALFPY